MKQPIKHIHLSWRRGKAHRRIMVGCINIENNSAIFEYLNDGVLEAKKEGFKGYPGLSLDQKIHTSNIVELFAKRLINLERTDSNDFLDFWEINPKYQDDSLYMLAMTQGKMHTDNFEFLASFEPEKNVCFVTDIAAITYNKFNLDHLKIGMKLSFEKDSNNKYDKDAVKVLIKDKIIGYIKKGHNSFFKGVNNNQISITVKSITNTINHKELYVKVQS